MMKKSDKKIWLKALRSGGYEQGMKSLCKDTGNNAYWCCLGVAIDVLHDGDWVRLSTGRWRMDGDGGMPTEQIGRELGISREVATRLAEMNDDGKSFEELANWIEKSKRL